MKQGKYALLIMLCIGLLFSCMACSSKTQNNGSSSSEGSSMTSTGESISSPDKRDPTPSELEKEQEIFPEKVNRLTSAKKIERLVLKSGVITADGYKEYQLESTDQEYISKWVNLMKNLKITAVPFEYMIGGGYALTFEIAGEKIEFGLFQGDTIAVYGENNLAVMLHINNYDELYSTFKELEKEMGYPKD